MNLLKNEKIGVLMGGRSAERSISIKTGQAILASLKRQGFAAVAIDPHQDLPKQLRSQKIDFAYIALHGPGGEDGKVQGLLDWMQIPYTGSGVLASAVAMDKAVCKSVLQKAGLPVAKGVVLTKKDTLPRLSFPVVVKPVSQGSAVGVSLVRSPKDLKPALQAAFRYDERVLVEHFLSGPEVTVGVLGDEALPVIEIVPAAERPFYDFQAKYAPGGSLHILPARLTSSVAAKIQRLALDACHAIGVRAVARVDGIVDRRLGPVILEINTIPGMTETSLLPEAAQAVGLSFDALVLKIAELSLSAGRPTGLHTNG